MAPMTPPTPDDIEAAAPLLAKLGAAFGWVAATVAVIYAAIKEIIRAGVEKRRYHELREDVSELRDSRHLYLTIEAHDALTELCHARLAKMSAEQLNAVVSEINDDISTMNANLCHLMGHMNVDPVATPRRRRKSDL